MIPWSRWRSMPLLVAGAAFVIAGLGGVRRAFAAPQTVVVVAPVGSRLADDLKRELEISAFTVLVVPAHATASDWREGARDMVNPDHPRAVAVRADDRQMIVLSRSSHAVGVQVSFDLQLDSDDRPTRRRACLTVVEYLRVLEENDDRRIGAPAVTAPVNDVPEVRALPAIDPEGDGDPASETAANASTRSERPWRGQPWTMGVGTTLDLSSTGWQPAGHLGFLWYFPLGPRLSIRARAEWPLLGVEFQSAGADVRLWTFGAAIGLQYAFAEVPSPWRPFLGLAVGNRIALTEVSSTSPLQGRDGVTPSANLGLQGGVRYSLGARTQIFSELELARDWMIPASNRMDYEKAAANAVSLHMTVGLLFEY
jgi:hypothetical protein